MANIFAELGFDGVLLGRIDYQEKEYRWKTRTPEMVWRGSDSLGESSDIFTGVMYNVYGPPPGFCFDILCDDEPFIDDKKSFEYNVDRRVDEFIDYLNNASKVYGTNNLVITMGEDFNYQDAEAWFVNLDKLIYYVNQRQANGSKYNLIYSTPSCYIKAIYDETQNKNNWLLKQDDFFPYASDPHAFWTGYFTSRPTLKRYERVGNNFLQVCKQLYSLADLGPEDQVDLNPLREAMGVMQHHDAIAGTEKQHVANDYARHLQRGIEECEIITRTAISQILNQTTKISSGKEGKLLVLNSCQLLNISQCAVTENSQKGFVVTIYNPLSRPVDKVVRLPVSGDSYIVNGVQGKKIQTQLVPIPDFVQNIPGRKSSANKELVFVASDLPPLGWKSYVVKEVAHHEDMTNIPHNKDSKNLVKDVAFTISPDTGLVSSVSIKNVTIPLNQNFYYYQGFVGDNSVFENRSSGAYIFRPKGSLQKIADKVAYKVYHGEVVAEVHQRFNEYISQIVRVNSIDNYVEFDWVVGPLPHGGPSGIEVVTKYTTNMQSNKVFYTDSNGKQMLKRIRDFRPTWKVNLSEPVSGNYYPVTSHISINDGKRQVSVLVDRAQGGTSLKDGEIELMVHRNCLHDDAFGVGEALNETAFGKGVVVRGSHYLTISHNVAATAKDIAQRRLLDTWTFITPIQNDKEQLNYAMEYSGLKTALPENVQILTFEPWTGFSFLLRLEHVYEKNEDPVLSRPVVVDIANLFTAFKIVSAKETTLGGNQWLEDNHRLHFKANGSLEDLRYQTTSQKLSMDDYVSGNQVRRQAVFNSDDSLRITLTPGQIRTFIVDIKKY